VFFQWLVAFNPAHQHLFAVIVCDQRNMFLRW
jgi:hypothetical protein